MPSTTIQSNRLTALGADIRAAHADVQRGATQVAERALAAGTALLEAKAAVPHGKWATWLTDAAGISARTAQRYMQLAASGVECATVADLGIKAASAALSRRTAPPSRWTGYDRWFAELSSKLDELEAAVPGFRAGFVSWAKSRTEADRYAETLLRNCPDDQLPALQAMIQKERDRTLLEAVRRAHVATEHQ